jgi:hypothetical protein
MGNGGIFEVFVSFFYFNLSEGAPQYFCEKFVFFVILSEAKES